MRSKMLSIDLEGAVARGRVTLQQIDPSEMSPGEFSHLILESVEKEGVRILAIDSLNGYLSAMPEERDVLLQLHELVTYLGQRGVTTLIILGQRGIVGTDIGVPLDVSYLSDSIILLRFFESAGTVRKAISVVKQRTANPEMTIREFTLDSGGLRVGEPLTQFQGVLSGIPTFLGSSDKLLGKAHP